MFICVFYFRDRLIPQFALHTPFPIKILDLYAGNLLEQGGTSIQGWTMKGSGAALALKHLNLHSLLFISHSLSMTNVRQNENPQ